MAATDHLGPQFYKYRPAKEEGREAANWLSTEQGHDWQDNYGMNTRNTSASPEEQHEDHGAEYSNSFFSVIPERELTHNIEDWSGWSEKASTWPEPRSFHDLDSPHSIVA